jgi:hypothetical protein
MTATTRTRVSPRWEHDSTHNSRKTVDTTKPLQLPLAEPHHPDDRGLSRGHSWLETKKRKSRLLPTSLTLVASSLLPDLGCFTWRSDGVSFGCFGDGLYMMGIIFGNTPFSLSSALLSRRSKAVYRDGLCFPLSISSFESTLYQDQESYISRVPSKVCVHCVFEVFLCIRECVWMVSKI